MRDVFGHEVVLPDRAMTVWERRQLFPSAKGLPSEPQGYADAPGTGPDGETCATCKHIFRKRLAGTYRKCGLMREFWTGGPKTDIRARSPACSKWERPE